MMSTDRQLPSKTIYHDGQDWIIQQGQEGYWYCRLDSETWRPGLPLGLTLEDAALLFS